MKVVAIALILIAGTLASAETKVYEVKGMHCEECAKSISKKVCTSAYEKCEVEVGKMTITAKSIDDGVIDRSLKSAGRYKIVKTTKIAE